MFQSIRYYSTLFVLFVLVVIGVFIVYAKYTGTRTIIQDAAAQHTELAEKYFQRQIWERYFPIVNFINTMKDKTVGSIPAYVLLQQELTDFFQMAEIADAVLLNNDKIIFELLPNHNVKEFANFDTSNLIVKKQMKGGGTKYLLKTLYIPSLTKLPESYKQFATDLDAKLFVYYDVDAPMRKFNNILIISSVLFSIVMLFILFYVYTCSIRTEKLLERGGVSALGKGGAMAKIENYEEKAQFYDNINRELRTPLNAIIGFSELVKNESAGPLENPQYKDFVQTIFEAGNQLLMLIDDIQDFAKAGENKLQIENEPLDLAKLARICMQMVENRAADSGIDLVDELGEEHYVINADPRRMKQVIMNLLTNAVKFTGKGGKVNVSFKFDSKNITLEVRDNGRGMSPDELTSALTPFGGMKEEEDGIKVKKQASTGLGLSLTKKLVELMGGKFDITSELNLGTKARLIFKVIDYKAFEEMVKKVGNHHLTLVEEDEAKSQEVKKLEEVLKHEDEMQKPNIKAEKKDKGGALQSDAFNDVKHEIAGTAQKEGEQKPEEKKLEKPKSDGEGFKFVDEDEDKDKDKDK